MLQNKLFPSSVLAVALLFSASALAQSDNPAWIDEMKEDAASVKQCEVTLILSMQEGTLGAQNVYEARIRCLDGRTFDASRTGDFEIFTFKECNIQVC